MSSAAYPPVIIDPERQIRTACLLPGTPEEEIRCELGVRSLKPLDGQTSPKANSTSAEYEALSYTWGSWQETVTIKLNGRPFLVTQNLHRALRRLRRLSSPRCLWVDQLCIDQHGNQERNHQVRIMNEVFRMAARVLVWLGEVPDEDLQNIRDLYEQEYLRETKELQIASCTTEPSWWTRAWVVQEFAMAREEPTVCFGTREIQWARLFTLNVSGGSRELAMLDELPRRFARLRSGANVKRNLAYFGSTLAHTDCSNPRDKVFSLLGLLPSTYNGLIKADYDNAVETVFAGATSAAILADRSYEILGLVRRSKGSFNLPSWVVDYSFPDEDRTNVSSNIFAFRGLFRPAPSPWCHSQSSSCPDADYNATNATLSIRGLHFDTIRLSIPVIEPLYDAFQYQAPFYRRAVEAVYSKAFVSPLDHSDPYASSNSTRSVSYLTNALTSGIQLFMRGGWRIASDLAMFLLNSWTDKMRAKYGITGESSTKWSTGTSAYHRFVAGGQAFFVTTRGFLGLGPAGLKDDDVIVLPYGSNAPVALRQEGLDWRFLGFTHVRGIMEDELRKINPEIKFHEQTYVLV
ncbi:Heterokaryon incompatibility protein 6, OR allele [Pseudocercospora fuligena]|uniref:Heterokaryon incompatibility protein 6, OR allele n=1 Tax=Pseudocercospora fuligena TaxID=685502 RepID=A0A8H6R6B7_9PEZI|nr:Heterokaryon incompatibility protein 6, OR allele [Pseudocercospora fuligena]